MMITSTDALQSIQEDLRQRRFMGAEAKCAACLQRDRTSPQVWLHLGEAYLRQGFGAAADLALRRAWLLDPEAKWPDALFAAVRQAPKGKMPTELKDLLKVASVRVAAAILVKDEARTIIRCLDSIRDSVDEIVVIDTGSTDGTLELVQGYADSRLKLIQHEWRDDFAEARNAGLVNVESDWVLWLDADEYLHAEDIAAVREVAGLFTGMGQAVIVRPVVINWLEGNQTFISYDTSRMFPTGQGLRFWGRIHEQIGGDREDERFLRPAVRIRLYHDGYLPEVVGRKNKPSRNLRMLTKQLEDTPDDPSTWLFYARETLLSGDVSLGIERLNHALEVANRHPEFARTAEVLTWLIQAHLKQSQFAQAEAACEALLARELDFPDTWYYKAYLRALRIQGEIQALDQDLKRMDAAYAAYRGIVSPDSQIKEWKGALLKADLARFAGNLTYAQAQYLAVLERHPEFGGVKKQLELIEQQRQQLRTIRLTDEKKG